MLAQELYSPFHSHALMLERSKKLGQSKHTFATMLLLGSVPRFSFNTWTTVLQTTCNTLLKVNFCVVYGRYDDILFKQEGSRRRRQLYSAKLSAVHSEIPPTTPFLSQIAIPCFRLHSITSFHATSQTIMSTFHWRRYRRCCGLWCLGWNLGGCNHGSCWSLCIWSGPW